MAFFKKQYIVREAQSSDLELLSEIHGSLFAKAWQVGEFINFKNQVSYKLWVAQQVGGKICGFNILRYVSGEAEIISIGVAKNHQRCGVGEKLMRCAINYLLAQKAKSLFLEVARGNVAACALYKNLGFRVISQRQDYYGNGESALVMELKFV